MIEIKNLTLRRGAKELLTNTSVALPPGGKIGLVGANGSGKSSLFAALTGEIITAAGDIILPAHCKIAVIAQETPALEIPARDYVLNADSERQYWLSRLEEQKQIQNQADLSAEIYNELANIDAFSAPARVAKLLSGLGFSEQQQQLPVCRFSGGWRRRLNLAQALFRPADLLLLDEPTNHLDLETVMWLENYLSNTNNSQIIISHDIAFLNHVTRQTLELNGQKLTLYAGNYDFYAAEKTRRLQKAQKAYSQKQQRINHLETYISRFRSKATKAKQAQSRIKALTKMVKIAPVHLSGPFSFAFFPLKNSSNPLLKIVSLSVGYEQTLLQDINYSIDNCARIGLLGINGSGKSTLIKTLTGEIKPLSGEIIRGDKLTVGYFAQHQIDYLDANLSVLEILRRCGKAAPDKTLRPYLAGFNFSELYINTKVGLLSGGEKARLALALLIWQRPNFLLLDEPTNHLDLETRVALTWALQSFTGAMLLVAHDRHLLETVCDEFIYIRDGKLHRLDCSLTDYKTANEPKSNNHPAAKTMPPQNPRVVKIAAARRRQELAILTKPWRQKQEKLTIEITALEKIKRRLEQNLADTAIYSSDNKALLNDTLRQNREISSSLAAKEEEWLACEQQICRANAGKNKS